MCAATRLTKKKNSNKKFPFLNRSTVLSERRESRCQWYGGSMARFGQKPTHTNRFIASMFGPSKVSGDQRMYVERLAARSATELFVYTTEIRRFKQMSAGLRVRAFPKQISVRSRDRTATVEQYVLSVGFGENVVRFR